MSFKRPKLTDFPYFPEGVQKSDLIELEDLRPGCQKPDCIQSIDNPKWVNYKGIQSDRAFDEEILVLLVQLPNGNIENYAFPTTIMDYHEIVNFTTHSGKKVALTYCPLCQTATGYNRELDGNELMLGVSGLLLNSALVLYDRNSLSLFSQVWSQGIVGKYVNQDLSQIPIIQTTIAECIEVYPDTQFLSHDTGFIHHQKRYGKYPYGDYKSSESVKFPVNNKDNQLHTKELVYIIEEKFLNDDSDKVFIHKQASLRGNVQHNENYYSVPVAGGRLFFAGRIDELKPLNFEQWIPNGISFYFAARAYFPSAELV
ncbi:MAG: DUF3179 domain-containing protein [Candidatus Heimdallarchaeota archaeon]|nr:DUF3179 domain-containing protein [Candidatus Heimdallarchaeota archaeon]